MRPDERPFWVPFFTVLAVGFTLLAIAARLGRR